jgi:hypothetical protein
VVKEEKGKMVSVEAFIADTEDADADEARTIMARPVQQRKVCVPISAPMCLTMVKSLQQI